ncbi:putative ArsR family transcriptional regulator [Salana multivorans]|uniref:Putative ArsR family transcriptional regulator n=1 Tax=Salana multivorans TaxID=120377 RepID=A0A3N2D1W5_9MICO|nr:HTH domain-containing protein [Salana multivorans]ROR93767.1 putative ArsR family transcriptional regulator [Salana multivorans]
MNESIAGSVVTAGPAGDPSHTGVAPHHLVPAPDADSTRTRVRALVVSQGPIDAARLAAELDLTPAGVRRHLQALVAAGEIAERLVPVTGPRGRGRPPREYVATTGAQEHLPDASGELAVEALDFIAAALGEPGVATFADGRLAELEARYLTVVEAAGDDIPARARALADALTADGYAASTRRPAGELPVLQLCQGHCPVQQAAERYPELCEAETRVISRLLGVHVQRLATIAAGGHACTTSVPLGLSAPPPPSAPASIAHAT